MSLEKCGKCGNDIADSASFCPHCGFPSGDASAPPRGVSPTVAPLAATSTAATIVDIHIPFVSMVVLMVKLSIAAIPAAIIISMLYMIMVVLLAGFGSGAF